MINAIRTTTSITHSSPSGDGSPTDRVIAAVDASLARHHIPGMSIAITRADRLLFSAGFGHSDLATGARATDSTQYLWFSLTKIATATAAMQLVDAGKLGLDQPVSDFVEVYRSDAGATPTVRHLLSHTAGFANPIPVRWVRPSHQPAPDPRAFLDRLLARQDTPKHPIGGAARYSNVGYLLLAEIITQCAGRPFTDYVTDTILHPLRMTQTGFAHTSERDAAVGYVRAPRVAIPLLRRLLPDGIVGERVGHHIALNRFLVNGPGYGGLVGTAADAARLAAMHLADGMLDGHTVLLPDTARLMRDIAAPGKPFDVGLGWFRKPTARHSTAVEHLGAGGGFYNAMRLYPDLGLGIVAMANTTKAWDHAALFDSIAGLDW